MIERTVTKNASKQAWNAYVYWAKRACRENFDSVAKFCDARATYYYRIFLQESQAWEAATQIKYWEAGH